MYMSKTLFAVSSLLAGALPSVAGAATCPAAPVQANFRYFGDHTCTQTGIVGDANLKEVTLTAGTCYNAEAFHLLTNALVYINSAQGRLINAAPGGATYAYNVYPLTNCGGKSLFSETIDNKIKPDCVANTDMNTMQGGLSVKLSKQS